MHRLRLAGRDLPGGSDSMSQILLIRERAVGQSASQQPGALEAMTQPVLQVTKLASGPATVFRILA
ncbi:hypothetical protein GCM10011586_22630 [Silvibacterium dinghuense]|nr:hypothetical protein GCM10011586_22630 [Silvibacterium dinghuense]